MAPAPQHAAGLADLGRSLEVVRDSCHAAQSRLARLIADGPHPPRLAARLEALAADMEALEELFARVLSPLARDLADAQRPGGAR